MEEAQKIERNRQMLKVCIETTVISLYFQSCPLHRYSHSKQLQQRNRKRSFVPSRNRRLSIW